MVKVTVNSGGLLTERKFLWGTNQSVAPYRQGQ